MFDGDFIFNGTVGRWDLPTGSLNELKNSLEKISKYDKDIVLYPGHGLETTIGEEELIWHTLI